MNILNKRSIGVDISDRTIEMVDLKFINNKISLIAHAQCSLEEGVVEKGRIIDSEKLKEKIQQLLEQSGFNNNEAKDIVLVLPENQVYTHFFELNTSIIKEKDIAEEAYSNIPIEKENLIYTYKALSAKKELFGEDDKQAQSEEKSKKRERVSRKYILLAATDKRILKDWQEFFAKMKIDVSFFDIEAFASFRGLSPNEEVVCMLDIGAKTTSISVLDQENLYYSASFGMAGDVFTEQLVRAGKEGDKQMTWDEAETYKKEKGLDDFVLSSLNPCLKTIINETKVAINYVNETYGIEASKVILLGGSSKLRGLKDYFTDNISYIYKKCDVSEDVPEECTQIVTNAEVLVKDLPVRCIAVAGASLHGLKEHAEDLHFSKLKIKHQKKKKKKQSKEKSEKALWVKEHPKEVQLIVIIIIGIFLLSWAFWYRGQKYNNTPKRGQISKIESYTFKETIPQSLSVYTGDDLGREDSSLFGNIVNVICFGVADCESKIRDMEKNLAEGEQYKELPQDTDEDSYPKDIKILTFSGVEASKLLTINVKKKIGKTGFIIDSIDYNKVQQVGDSAYNLESSVMISAEKDLDVDNLFLEDIQDLKEKTFVEPSISSLNARSGPGKEFSVVGSLKSGNSYEFLASSGGWSQVKLTDELTAWAYEGFLLKSD